MRKEADRVSEAGPEGVNQCQAQDQKEVQDGAEQGRGS